jgi:hypothetical protein
MDAGSGSAMPAAAGMPAGGAESMMPAGGDAGMGMPGMGMPGMGAFSLDPAEGRYVDNQYQALKAETLRSALRADTTADAFLVVAKRMPVRMRLVVDERKLPRLLAQFGNAMLPVEVRQVRINRARDTGGGGYDMGMGGGYGMMGGSEMGAGYAPPGMPGMAGMPGMMGTMPGMDAMPGMDSGMGMGYTPPGMGGSGYPSTESGMGMGMPGQEQNLKDRTTVAATSVHDVPVEIYGIIYIYNPVDEKKLGLEQQPGLTGTAAPAAAAPAS